MPRTPSLAPPPKIVRESLLGREVGCLASRQKLVRTKQNGYWGLQLGLSGYSICWTVVRTEFESLQPI